MSKVFLEVYLMPNVLLFSLESNDDPEKNRENFRKKLLEISKQKVLDLITIEVYYGPYFCHFFDIDLDCENGSCQLGSFDPKSDKCRLCMSEFVVEEFQTRVNNLKA